MTFDLKYDLSDAHIDNKIDDLRYKDNHIELDNRQQMRELVVEYQEHHKGFCHPLNGSNLAQLAKHRDRPGTADYIRLMCDDFFELHGDRRSGDDHTILGGPATFADQTIMLIGQHKEHDTIKIQENNYGMPHPEGFRKAQRLMRQAEKFGFPLVCLINAPEAETEEQGQTQAIAETLAAMSTLRVQTIAIIIGEGGGIGGALALSLADRLLMLEYATCTVASHETVNLMMRNKYRYTASANGERQLSSQDLMELGVIDGIIMEPPGGAHCDHCTAAKLLAEQLYITLEELREISIAELLKQRYTKFRYIGNSS